MSMLTVHVLVGKAGCMASYRDTKKGLTCWSVPPSPFATHLCWSICWPAGSGGDEEEEFKSDTILLFSVGPATHVVQVTLLLNLIEVGLSNKMKVCRGKNLL